MTIITTISNALSVVDVVLDKTIRKVSVTSTHYVCVFATQFSSILKTIVMPSANTETLLYRNMTWEFLMATFPFIMYIGPT
jgi:hypothetical protein